MNSLTIWPVLVLDPADLAGNSAIADRAEVVEAMRRGLAAAVRHAAAPY
jgi:hypothetical protein